MAMGYHILTPRSLLPDDRLDWIYVVDLVVALIVAIFFLFYFNRLFATIVSYAIRKYTWYYYRVYVDFQALQVSPLAGRIFFRGFRYHGRNETILVSDGYITWRYWLRRVRDADVFQKARSGSGTDTGSLNAGITRANDGEKGGKSMSTNLPCRISIKIRGLEWYIYNRTPAYDMIVESISKTDDAGGPAQEGSTRRRNKLTKEHVSRNSIPQEKTELGSDRMSKSIKADDEKSTVHGDKDLGPTPPTSTTEASSKPNPSSEDLALTLPLAIQALPVKLQCTKGAIVMGNQNTRSILTAKFDEATGVIDVRSASDQDLYKQTIELDFKHPVVQFKANKDFKESQLAEGNRMHEMEYESKHVCPSALRRKDGKITATLWDTMRHVLPHAARSTASLGGKRVTSAQNNGPEAVPGQQRWLGLTRYMDDEDETLEQERWKNVEYAQNSMIVDSPSIGASIRWDVPGTVSKDLPSPSGASSKSTMDINGCKPPDWSIDLSIRGGEIKYGPWADRQRSDLQNMFFPTLYKDAIPATPLKAGQARVSTVFKLVIEVEECTTLVIPTREESKDWKWKGRATSGDGPKVRRRGKKHRSKKKRGDKDNLNPEIRPFGWLDLKVSADSAVSLTMDMVAGSSGYRTNLVIDLRESEMKSSVNHDVFWRSESQLVSCDLSNPLKWNTLRQWQIDVQCKKLELFLLRDHIFLLTDVINDWSSGPPADYYTFVPFIYTIGLRLDGFKLFVNANDSNIIDNPADVDDNTFVVIWGKELGAEISIPLKNFRPSRNEITFDVGARDGGFELRTPHWNTQHTFLNDAGVASLREMKIKGSYDHATTTSPSLTDILSMEVYGDSLKVHLYGFLIRYLMKVKDNYFGEDLHFRTLEEYQSQMRDPAGTSGDSTHTTPHTKFSNDLDVILKIVAEKSIAILPARLYSTSESINLDICSVVADLRFTNYYMDLAVSFSPIAVARRGSLMLHSSPSDVESSTQIFIDGLEVFGHRLFGMPPTEPTYVCNWDFELGSVTGECSIEFLRALQSSIRCFGFSFDDHENALPPLNPPVIHDVTFLRLSSQSVEVWLRQGPASFLLSTKAISLEFNDWAGNHISERMHLQILEFVIANIGEGPSDNQGNVIMAGSTQAYIGATIDLRMLNRKKNFDEDRQLQQHHMKLHDSRTHRTPWLLHSDLATAPVGSNPETKIRPPAMQYPLMPEPVVDWQNSILQRDPLLSKSSSSTSSGTSTRKSSFLTTRSSEQSRVLHDGSERRKESEPPTLGTSSITESSSELLRDQSVPMRERRGSGKAQNRFAFSSAYRAPYFPLCGFELDLRDVPAYSGQLRPDTGASEVPIPGNLHFSAQEHDIERGSFLIDFSQGLRALCTSTALLYVQILLDALQLDDSTALLDSLQMETMADVSPSLQDDRNEASITDINIRMPYVQARLLSSATTGSDATQGRVGVDASLERLKLTSRLSQGHPKPSDDVVGSPSSAHIALDQITVSVVGVPNQAEHMANLASCVMLEPVLWTTFGHSPVLDVKFQEIEFLVTSPKLGDVLLIGSRELDRVQNAGRKLSEIAHRQKLRLRKLVYHLASDGDEVLDPPFLTRASYVLRSATNHMRTCDSWKIMSRLRFIYNDFPVGRKGIIYELGRRDPAAIPNDGRARVISSFEHWRAWDLTNVKESSLIRRLYGKQGISNDEGTAWSNSRASFHAGNIRLALETSLHPSEIVIERLILALEHDTLAVVDSTSKANVSLPTTHSKFQVSAAKAMVHASWDIYEVVEKLFEAMNSRPASEGVKATWLTDSDPQEPSTDNQQSTNLDHHIHAVLCLGVLVLKLDSPNLSNASLCEDLRISSLLSTAKPGMATNLLVAASGASSETADHSRILAQSMIRSPSVAASLSDQMGSDQPQKVWKVIASSSELSQKILQDPLVMIETVDVLLRDEVAHVQRLMSSLHSEVPMTRHDAPRKTQLSNNGAHVTLFVDAYLLSLAILPTLNYRISGKIARSTIQHGLRHKTETLIGFDIKDHVHVLATTRNDMSHDIAALEIPPINGCLSLDLGPTRRSAAVHVMVESIRLDASEVHALLVTINRQEISDLSTGIGREATLLQRRFDGLFADSKSKPKSTAPKSPPLLYDAHLIVAGLGIHATSPTSSAATREGRMHFNLGSVQIKSTNKASDTGPALKFPELEVVLDTVRASLLRVEDSGEYPSGDLAIAAKLRQTSKADPETGKLLRAYKVNVAKLNVNLNAETPTMMINILGHLQDTLKSIELSPELTRLRSLTRTRVHSEASLALSTSPSMGISDDTASTALFNAMYFLELEHIRVSWKIGSTTPISPGREAEDLVLSFSKIDLSTKRDNAARLLIQNLQLQMVPVSQTMFSDPSLNSALLPEVVFNVAYLSTGKDRRLAFQAAGKSLDLQLTSQFLLPVSDLRRSIAYAVQEVRAATANWNASAHEKGAPRKALLGDKNFASILVDADFAGAVVYIQGRSVGDSPASALQVPKRMPQHGRYNQFTPGDTGTSTSLRAPGLAFKIEYKNPSAEEQSLSAEVKVDASSNVLHPTVVPLIMEISSSVKEMVSDPESPKQPTKAKPKTSTFIDEDRLRSADPSAIFGKCRVNLGLRICKQEFSLTCQPITKVDAIARFEDIYVTVNTVQSAEHGQFYTLSGVGRKLQASVQHAYSRDPTGSLDVESLVVSLMSSKHVSDTNGLSIILKISPAKAQINGRQLQDFLLFREIWAPPEIRHAPAADVPSASAEPQDFIVQRYQQIAATGAFPWTATAAIAQLDISLDLGQSLGRTSFSISNVWVSSKKSSNYEQNLCLGFDRIAMDSTGRMSGLIELQSLRVRTSIRWPITEGASNQRPLVQASLAFDNFRVKAAFDYQAFAIANITTIEFLMYNVRDPDKASNDRLVCIVRGDKAQAFCTATSASQAVGLFQAVERLIQEKHAAYDSSLKDIERYLRRRSAVSPLAMQGAAARAVARRDDSNKLPIRLQTKVVVRLGAVNFGVYPSTFFDNQIFQAEVTGASAQFSVFLDHGKIQSSLSLNLGQLRVALSGSVRPSSPKKLGEIAIDEVVASATGSRGGTILKVPKVIATMQTWQIPDSTNIDYIFKSSFQGNIDVGWNYSRISFIRGMFANHSRALAQRLGKPLPESAVQITGAPQPPGEKDEASDEGQQKITAVVNVPLSKYQYTPLQDPVIDTPKLTQLGDATPPLEWIGLHRERLPNLTHQIVIVSLLEVAKEVEDAYSRILGSS